MGTKIKGQQNGCNKNVKFLGYMISNAAKNLFALPLTEQYLRKRIEKLRTSNIVE